MGSGGQKQESTTTTEPWGPWGDAAQFGMDQMLSQFNDPMQQFSGSTVGPRSAMSLQSEQGGLGLLNDATPQQMAFLQNIMSGNMLTPEAGNPYIQGIGDMAAADTTRDFKRSMIPGASLGAAKAGSGAQTNMNSGAYQQLSNSLARNRFGLLGNNYNMERGYQQQAPGMMQNVMGARGRNLGMANQLGASSDMYAQRQRDDQVNKFNFRENEDRQRLATFVNQLTGFAGQGGTQHQVGTIPGQPFTGAQAAGLGLGIAGLFTGSSRAFKHSEGVMDSQDALTAIQSLDVDRWRYTADAAARFGESEATHIGPYAEDFQQAFNVGDGMSISLIDMHGATISALKGAAERISTLEQRINDLEMRGV